MSDGTTDEPADRQRMDPAAPDRGMMPTTTGGEAGVGAGSDQRSFVVVAGLVAGVVAFALARWALLPGLGFWDTGEFQTVGPALGTAHPTGFPAYVILSWLASIVLQPFGDPAFRTNLLSALLVGGATGLTVALAWTLTRYVWIAFAAGVVMAAVPIVWNIGTHADAHALHLLLVALLFLILVGWEQRVRAARRDVEDPVDGPSAPRHADARAAATDASASQPGDRWLRAAAVVYGVGLANHTLMLLLAPGIGLFVLATASTILRRPRFIAALAGTMFLTAFALYLELPLRAGLLRGPIVYGHPERIDGFLYVVLAQQFVGSLYQPFADLGDKTVALVNIGYEQLGVLVALVPLGFVATLWRQPRYAILSGVTFLVTAWFAASYVNADISRYYLGPAVLVLTWLAILAAEVVEWITRIVPVRPEDVDSPDDQAPDVVGRPSWFGSTGPAMLFLEAGVALALLTPTINAIPDRAATADLSDQDAAQQWADAAMAVFQPNAVVVSWWSYSTTLWYAQIIEGQRPDVWIVDDRTRLDDNLGDLTDVIDAELGKRPVYLVRLTDEDLEAVEARYEIQEFEMPTEQSVLQVLGKRST